MIGLILIGIGAAVICLYLLAKFWVGVRHGVDALPPLSDYWKEPKQ